MRRIVAAADLDESDVVLEIGPGLGSLTLGLAERVQRVVAVEIDAGFVTVLDEVLEGIGNVEVVHADALRSDLAALVGERPARLVANLPYNVATPVVFRALADPMITDVFVMVQREVAERWRAQVGDPAYGAVSLKLGLVAEVTIELSIPRGVFLPVPNVDSSMVRLTRRASAPPLEQWDRLCGLADIAFAQRRKTLRNTLRGVADPDRLAAAAQAAGIDLGLRAEMLHGNDLQRLQDALGAIAT